MNSLLIPFQPHPMVRGPVLQTVVASQVAGEIPNPAERFMHRVRVGDSSILMVLEQPSKQPDSPMILLAHGMGGCSESGYIRRISHKLYQEGFHVFQMNHRGSGPGMGMADRLWNGGSSDDLAAVIEYIVAQYPQQTLLIAGFSLSGNILLKYLGEGRSVPSNVVSALAVNPPIDLEISSRAISDGPFARMFNQYYLSLMHRQAEAMLECFPGAYAPSGKARTIYEFDVEYTAPAANFKSVEEYYSQSSAGQFLPLIQVPTVILSAKDDPFVPSAVFHNLRMGSCVRLVDPDFGGHMGYLAKKRTPYGDRRWMDYACLEWAKNALLDSQYSGEFSAIAV